MRTADHIRATSAIESDTTLLVRQVAGFRRTDGEPSVQFRTPWSTKKESFTWLRQSRGSLSG